jgi:hypothetical protein
MFSWLSSTRSVKFAEDLATAVMGMVPNDKTLSEAKRLSKSNYAKEKLGKKIHAFKQEEILNFYKTAKLLNTFKWALKDAGYDEAFIDGFAAWVFLKLRESQS